MSGQQVLKTPPQLFRIGPLLCNGRLFKVETTKDKMISLCSKMYCASDITEEKIKFSCKGIQKDGNNVNYQKFHNVLFNKHEDKVLNKGFVTLEAV